MYTADDLIEDQAKLIEQQAKLIELLTKQLTEIRKPIIFQDSNKPFLP